MGGRQLLALLVLLLCCAAHARKLQLAPQHLALQGSPFEGSALNPRPLIGILSQPGNGEGRETRKKGGLGLEGGEYNTSYIAASYVKFIEAAGARVVPILFDTPEEDLPALFGAINGLLLPGGGASVSLHTPFMRTAAKLFRMAMDANDGGDVFPIHGTCLGYEMLSILVSKDDQVLEPFRAEGAPSILEFTSPSAKERAMFGHMSPHLKNRITQVPLAYENHEYGLSPEKFQSNSELSSFFRVLTTSPDQMGRNYVSTVEARKYPFFGTQWHPEKNPYEWSSPTIPHTAEAIAVSQAAASHFVSLARKSGHVPASIKQEESLLIYNYSPVYTGRDGGYFTQSYVFDLLKATTRVE